MSCESCPWYHNNCVQVVPHIYFLYFSFVSKLDYQVRNVMTLTTNYVSDCLIQQLKT